MATKIIEIPEDELRKIHSRLDVHKQAITHLARMCAGEIGNAAADCVLDMLEESQNPFEVSDDNA